MAAVSGDLGSLSMSWGRSLTTDERVWQPGSLEMNVRGRARCTFRVDVGGDGSERDDEAGAGAGDVSARAGGAR